MTSTTGSATREHPGDGAVAVGPGVAELKRALRVLGSFVATADPARYSGTDAVTLVDEFTRAKRVAATGEALFAARAATTHQPEAGGFPTPVHWLAGHTGESLGQAADVLRLGEAVGDDGPMGKACRDGTLSASAARMIADARRVNPGAEEDLVEAAATATHRQLRDRCDRAKADARSAEEDRARAKRLHDNRYCRTWTDRDGAFALEARLTPLAGARLKAALAGQTEALFHEARRAGERTPHQTLQADALVALTTGEGLSGSPDGTHPASTDSNGGDSDGRDPVRRPPPAQVILRLDLAVLRRAQARRDGPRPTGTDGTNETTTTGTTTCTGTTGGLCEIPGVGPVPLDAALALMGDSLTNLVITNGVDVTTVCTLGRSVPHALKVALMERDRWCVVPGCDATQNLEIDHWRIPFAEGGPASLDNLCRLCRFHHRLKTHQGFTLSKEGDTWIWEPPTRGGTPKDRTDPGHDPGSEPPEPDPDPTEPRLFSLDE